MTTLQVLAKAMKRIIFLEEPKWLQWQLAIVVGLLAAWIGVSIQYADVETDVSLFLLRITLPLIPLMVMSSVRLEIAAMAIPHPPIVRVFFDPARRCQAVLVATTVAIFGLMIALDPTSGITFLFAEFSFGAVIKLGMGYARWLDEPLNNQQAVRAPRTRAVC
jgi:hypothetical protein